MKQTRSVTHTEYYAAIEADNAWQVALDGAKIDRWSRAASGVEGSELRRLCEAKLAADEAWRAVMRQQRENSLHEFRSMHGTDSCWNCDSDYAVHE